MSKLVLISVLALSTALPAQQPERQFLDRIVAVVEQTPITDSEVRQQARLDAFVEGQPLNLAPAGLRNALDRLIYQRLAEQEMRIADFDTVDDETINTQLAQLRQLTFDGNRPYAPALRHYGVSEAAVREFLSRFLTLERFLAFRFRTGLDPSDEEIEQRYLSDYPPSDEDRPPLSLVQDAIRAQLTTEIADHAVEDWIRELRGRTYVDELYDYTAAPQEETP